MQTLVDELREVIINQLTEQLKRTDELLREKLSEMLERIETALIEQFGKTFVQFNEATQAIKKWQEDHRVQVEQLTEAFRETAAGIERIRADCEQIPATMAQLRNLMGELDERLKAFADMKESAEQSFPVIKQHLDRIGADLQSSAAGFAGLEKTIQDTYTQVGELAQRHIEISHQHIEQVGAQINRTAESVQETADRMMERNESASRQHLQKIQEIVQSVGNEAANMISATRDSSLQNQRHLAEFANSVQQQTERSVTEMADKMQTMTNEHLEDISKAMVGITESWGKNMVGLAEELKNTIANTRR